MRIWFSDSSFCDYFGLVDDFSFNFEASFHNFRNSRRIPLNSNMLLRVIRGSLFSDNFNILLLKHLS
jgi:hypothetical protein